MAPLGRILVHPPGQCPGRESGLCRHAVVDNAQPTIRSTLQARPNPMHCQRVVRACLSQLQILADGQYHLACGVFRRSKRTAHWVQDRLLQLRHWLAALVLAIRYVPPRGRLVQLCRCQSFRQREVRQAHRLLSRHHLALLVRTSTPDGWRYAMRFCCLLITTTLSLLPGAAFADGMPSRTGYACCESPTWSGLYAGFYAGGGWADTGWTFPFVETFNTTPGQHFSTSPQGGIVGMQAGINYQIGYFLVGAEASFAGSNMVETLTGPVTATLSSDRLRTDVSNLFTATGRIGVAADKFLFYGKGGYANSNVDVKA